MKNLKLYLFHNDSTFMLQFFTLICSEWFTTCGFENNSPLHLCNSRGFQLAMTTRGALKELPNTKADFYITSENKST